MTFIEFIGFLVTMFALIFLYLKRYFNEKKRAEHPEEYEEYQHQKEQALEDFFRSLNIDVPPPEIEKEVPPPPPPKKESIPLALQIRQKKRPIRKVKYDYELDTHFDDFEPYSAVADRELEKHITEETIDIYTRDIVSDDLLMAESLKRAYEIPTGRASARIETYVDRLDDLRSMILYRELIGPPKSKELWIDTHYF